MFLSHLIAQSVIPVVLLPTCGAAGFIFNVCRGNAIFSSCRLCVHVLVCAWSCRIFLRLGQPLVLAVHTPAQQNLSS